MAVTLDTNAESAVSSDSPKTLAYTCGANAKVLVLMIVGADNGARTGGDPTFNSLPMTQANSEQLGSGEGSAEIWYRLNPPVSSEYTISVPNSGAKDLRLFAASFNASGGGMALDVQNGYNTTEANPSLNVTTNYDGEAVLAVLASGYKDVVNSRSHTPLYEHDDGSWNNACQYTIQGSQGSITLSYTQSSDDVAMVLAAFREVTVTYVDLIGSSAWTSSASGVLKSYGSLKGSAAVTSAVGGVAKVMRNVVGGLASVAAVTGLAKVVRNVVGSSTGQATAAGVMKAYRGLVASSAFVSSVDGVMARLKSLVAASSAQATVAGTVGVVRGLVGETAAQAAAAGVLTVEHAGGPVAPWHILRGEGYS